MGGSLDAIRTTTRRTGSGTLPLPMVNTVPPPGEHLPRLREQEGRPDLTLGREVATHKAVRGDPNGPLHSLWAAMSVRAQYWSSRIRSDHTPCGPTRTSGI